MIKCRRTYIFFICTVYHIDIYTVELFRYLTKKMYRLWCHYTAHVVLFTVTKPCISDWADRLSEIMFSRPGVPLVVCGTE